MGIHLGGTPGMSNLVTLLMGYVLLELGKRVARLRSVFLKVGIYYLTMLFLTLDAINLSIGPFIYGGGANGIAAGLDINRYVIQVLFFLVLLANRELLAQRLLPIYGVETEHPLLRPWMRFAVRSRGNR